MSPMPLEPPKNKKDKGDNTCKKSKTKRVDKSTLSVNVKYNEVMLTTMIDKARGMVNG